MLVSCRIRASQTGVTVMRFFPPLKAATIEQIQPGTCFAFDLRGTFHIGLLSCLCLQERLRPSQGRLGLSLLSRQAIRTWTEIPAFYSAA